MLFLDEAAIWLTQPNTYSWRKVAQPLAVPTSRVRGITARLNLMGCVDLVTQAVQYRELSGNTTGKDTRAFLETLSQQADPACPTVVLADRASIHTCQAVHEQRKAWKKRGLIVVYLPPYSPELNPMEGQWRQLKYHQLSQRHFQDKDDLRRAVTHTNWGIAI